MSTAVESVAKPVEVHVKKKMTVVFDDGSRKQNLKPESVQDLIASTRIKSIVIQASEPSACLKVITDIAEATHRKVVPTDSGFELTREISDGDRSPKLPYILLDAEHTYTDAEEARDDFLASLPVDVEVPEKKNRPISGTFQRGSVTGQLHALWKDIKSYGIHGTPKRLMSFVDEVAAVGSPMEAAYASYKKLMTEGVKPHENLNENNRVDHDYFKFWVIMQLVRTQRTYWESLEPATAE